MYRYLLFFICFYVTEATTFAQKGSVKIRADKQTSSVDYYMSHPLHDFEGVNKKVSAIAIYHPTNESIETAAVVLSIADFSSGNGNRDSHAMEVLEALKYPLISFTSTSIQEGKDSLSIKGILNFHNVKRPISFKALKTIKGKQLKVVGGFKIDMTDYNVKPPSLLGLETSKIIKLVFSVNFDLP